MQRKPIIAGNWKMYKTGREAKEFISSLAPLVKGASCRVFIAAPFTAIRDAAAAAQGTSLAIGAQNMHDAIDGAFTGEVSAGMLKEAGASFVILGHSERRQYFQETNAFINRKIKRALEEKLIPIYCIGESLEQREQGKTKEVLLKQLEEGLADLGSDEVKPLVIAYEPIWAIGTGKTATPEMAEEAHGQIRKWLEQRFGKPMADMAPILYGGSVKPESARDLMQQPNIDGALVGGASLDASVFSKIVNHATT